MDDMETGDLAFGWLIGWKKTRVRAARFSLKVIRDGWVLGSKAMGGSSGIHCQRLRSYFALQGARQAICQSQKPRSVRKFTQDALRL